MSKKHNVIFKELLNILCRDCTLLYKSVLQYDEIRIVFFWLSCKKNLKEPETQ